MRWRTEATKNGHTITRFAVAFEAGRDGFWLARWLLGPRHRNLRHSSNEAQPYRASIAARKQIGSTLDCSNASSSVGCVANQITAHGSDSNAGGRRMRSARTVSVRASFVSARAS